MFGSGCIERIDCGTVLASAAAANLSRSNGGWTTTPARSGCGPDSTLRRTLDSVDHQSFWPPAVTFKRARKKAWKLVEKSPGGFPWLTVGQDAWQVDVPSLGRPLDYGHVNAREAPATSSEHLEECHAPPC